MINAIISLSFLAIKEKNYINIYKTYDEYFSNFSIVNDILRSLGWMILKGLLAIASMLNVLLDKAFSFINFLNNSKFVNFYNQLKPLVWLVLLFALLYLAYCYLVAHEKPKGVITNIFIFMGTIMLLPYMMTQMNQLVAYGKELLSSDMENSGYELLVPYITDLVYLDSINFNSKKIANGECNGFKKQDSQNSANSSDNIKYININEVVDPDDYSLNNEKLFKQQLSADIKNGKSSLQVTDIKKGKFFFKDSTPYYYRYHVNFFVAALYLLALILVMAFSSFKLIQLVYELAAEKVMAPFIAAGDLTGGQKIRKALIGILNGYITILCVLFLQRLFIISTEYINAQTWSDNTAANGCIKTVMILAGALFIIDGPNFFEQIFGVDAGLKSVGQALQSAYYGSQMLGGIKRSAAGVVGKVGGAAKTTAGKAIGLAGALSGMKDTGAFETNNEKVSQDMAMWFGPQELDPSHALGDGSDDIGTGEFSELPGGGQPGLPGGSTQQKESGIQSESENVGNDTGLSGGAGKQNLTGTQSEKNSEQAANVNQAINDSLDNLSANANVSQESSGSVEEGIRDNDNLANWAMRNTRVGRFVKDSYEKGKSLGHATGNTINERNRKKENNTPKENIQSFVYIKDPSDEMNKDNLK